MVVCTCVRRAREKKSEGVVIYVCTMAFLELRRLLHVIVVRKKVRNVIDSSTFYRWTKCTLSPFELLRAVHVRDVSISRSIAISEVVFDRTRRWKQIGTNRVSVVSSFNALHVRHVTCQRRDIFSITENARIRLSNRTRTNFTMFYQNFP